MPNDHPTFKQGSSYIPEHLDTTEKIYALPESQLRTLSLFNVLIPFFFSLATGCSTFALGVMVNMNLAKPTDDVARFAEGLYWVLFCAAGVFLAAAILFAFMKRGDVKRLTTSAIVQGT